MASDRSVAYPHEYAASNLRQVLFYYALFLAADWLAAAFAFALERRERWRLLWWLFLQRFGYRQVMYYVMVKSVAAAARGALVGWGKLERKATVGARPRRPRRSWSRLCINIQVRLMNAANYPAASE